MYVQQSTVTNPSYHRQRMKALLVKSSQSTYSHLFTSISKHVDSTANSNKYESNWSLSFCHQSLELAVVAAIASPCKLF